MKLTEKDIKLNAKFSSKSEAIEYVGEMLVAGGYVSEQYILGIHKRDEQVSVYMGNDLAIPHASDEYRNYINKTGIVIVQVPNGVDFDNNNVRLLVAIAAVGDEHMDILSNIAILCSEQAMVDQLVMAKDSDTIIKLIEKGA